MNRINGSAVIVAGFYGLFLLWLVVSCLLKMGGR